jgi:hypothetical protein
MREHVVFVLKNQFLKYVDPFLASFENLLPPCDLLWVSLGGAR